jgi:NADPH2:quinone reductase
VLVDLKAVSTVPIDWKLRAGLLQKYFTVTFPKTPGRDGAGIVRAVGEGVAGIAAGDRVCVMASHGGQGTYAEAVACPAADVLPLPAPLSFLEAASLVNAGLSAWICVADVADVQPGMKVLGHGGSGAVGGLIVQLARHRGATVTATCRAANRDYVLGLGAERAIAYDTEDFSTLREQDVVFDLVGGETHARSYPVLRPGGHLVFLVAAPIVDRGAEFGVRVTRAMVADARGPVERVLALAAEGVLHPPVAGTLPLGEAARAHRMMEAGEVTRGRMMLVP